MSKVVTQDAARAAALAAIEQLLSLMQWALDHEYAWSDIFSALNSGSWPSTGTVGGTSVSLGLPNAPQIDAADLAAIAASYVNGPGLAAVFPGQLGAVIAHYPDLRDFLRGPLDVLRDELDLWSLSQAKVHRRRTCVRYHRV